MAMKERVDIARRFLRSIRIDTDLGDAKALEGFVCPQSSADILLTMARHVSETGQGAFTWTGPYGSGKSSLVIALSALLNGNAGLQQQAAKVFGRKLTTTIWKALPTGTKGWRVLPVVGRRDHPVRVIGDPAPREQVLCPCRLLAPCDQSRPCQPLAAAGQRAEIACPGTAAHLLARGVATAP